MSILACPHRHVKPRPPAAPALSLPQGASRITCPLELAGGPQAAQQPDAGSPSPSPCPPSVSQSLKFFPNFDKLKIGFYCSFSVDDRKKVFAVLDAQRAAARDNDAGLSLVDFGGDWLFQCHAAGKKGGFGYHISRDDVHLFFSARENISLTPNVYIEIGSKSCWRPGHLLVVGQLIDFINFLGGVIEKHKISEVHMCCDAVGIKISELPVSDRSNWVCRVHQIGTFQKYENLRGVTAVSFADSELSGRGQIQVSGVSMGSKCAIHSVLYDKIYEGRRHPEKQAVFLDAWGEADWEGLSVTRVEYHLKREILKQFKIDTYDHLIENSDNIWAYLTNEWQRLVIPGQVDRENRHQDRALLHPFWQEIQTVKFGDGWSRDLIRETPPPSADVETMIRSVAGYALSLGVIAGVSPDDSVGCSALVSKLIRKYLISLDNEFEGMDEKSKFYVKMNNRKARLLPFRFGLSVSLPLN